MVAGENIANRAAVGDDISLEAPLATKLILKQVLVSTGRFSVDRVEGAHDRSCLAFDNGGAETRLIGVELVVLAHVDVGEMARGLRAAVHIEMLGRGDDAIILWVVALHAGDKSHTHAADEERVLPVGLLAAAPARVAKEV